MEVSRVDAGVKQTIIDDLVRGVCLFVFFKKFKRFLEIHAISIILEPIDEGCVCEVVRLDSGK